MAEGQAYLDTGPLGGGWYTVLSDAWISEVQGCWPDQGVEPFLECLLFLAGGSKHPAALLNMESIGAVLHRSPWIASSTSSGRGPGELMDAACAYARGGPPRLDELIALGVDYHALVPGWMKSHHNIRQMQEAFGRPVWTFGPDIIDRLPERILFPWTDVSFLPYDWERLMGLRAQLYRPFVSNVIDTLRQRLGLDAPGRSPSSLLHKWFFDAMNLLDVLLAAASKAPRDQLTSLAIEGGPVAVGSAIGAGSSVAEYDLSSSDGIRRAAANCIALACEGRFSEIVGDMARVAYLWQLRTHGRVN